MSGWNLPPGCTDNDIEVAQGAAAYCERCGQFYVIGEKDTELCPQCEGEENE